LADAEPTHGCQTRRRGVSAQVSLPLVMAGQITASIPTRRPATPFLARAELRVRVKRLDLLPNVPRALFNVSAWPRRRPQAAGCPVPAAVPAAPARTAPAYDEIAIRSVILCARSQPCPPHLRLSRYRAAANLSHPIPFGAAPSALSPAAITGRGNGQSSTTPPTGNRKAYGQTDAQTRLLIDQVLIEPPQSEHRPRSRIRSNRLLSRQPYGTRAPRGIFSLSIPNRPLTPASSLKSNLKNAASEKSEFGQLWAKRSRKPALSVVEGDCGCTSELLVGTLESGHQPVTPAPPKCTHSLYAQTMVRFTVLARLQRHSTVVSARPHAHPGRMPA